MTSPGTPRVIALEEHYWDREIAATFDPLDGVRGAPGIVERLFDYGDLRIKEMDEAGIDVQVLSHGAPATQRLEGEAAVTLARGANDRLREIVRAHPDRFAGFAALPTADPKAAADELERPSRSSASRARWCTASRTGCSSTTSASGRSSSARRRSTCRSTCIRPRRIRPSSRRTTRTT